MKCDGLAVLFHENAEEKWRVGEGLFIAAAGARMGKELIELKRRINREDSVSGMIFRRRWKKTSNRGPHVGEGERDQGVPVQEWLDGPRAPFLF
jgi:hypothetical protein